jgi:hypothetical protein
MRFIAITRLISPVPPEQLPSIMERFAEWREQYRDHLQSFEFFAGSSGGFMVINVADEVMLNQLMAEYPFLNYLDIEVRPIIDGDTALAQWWQVMRQMLGDAEPAEATMASTEVELVGGETSSGPPAQSPMEPSPPGPPPDAHPPA